MAIDNVRLIVVTQSCEIIDTIRDHFSKEKGFEAILSVSSLALINNKMSRSSTNIMLLDLDCQGIVSASHLTQLVEKNKLLIVLTASSAFTARTFLKGRIRDFIVKPTSFSNRSSSITYTGNLLMKIKTFHDQSPALTFTSMIKTVNTTQKILVIASSTGGPEALEKLFKAWPEDIPPTLVVQHMPSGFTKFFADRLNNICPMEIKEAANNDYLRKGLILIAPADSHMILIKKDNKLAVECFKGQKLHGVMPAADILFDSIPPIMRGNVIGVILTGMGADGAKGMMKMHLAGAQTIGQDKESSVVYGMPKVAFDLGAIDFQLPLDKIAQKVLSLI